MKTVKINGNYDRIVSKKVKQINNILRVLQKCNISSDSHKSRNLPFFSRDIDQKSFLLNNSIKLKDYNIPAKLNRNIKLIYELLGDPEREIYMGEWTIMSLKEAMERYQGFCKENRKDVFDIGYKYIGMGHITVISCDLNTHLLFYRPDGGSNGYDRQYNYEEIVKNGSDKYDKFYFSKWFYNLKL